MLGAWGPVITRMRARNLPRYLARALGQARLARLGRRRQSRVMTRSRLLGASAVLAPRGPRRDEWTFRRDRRSLSGTGYWYSRTALRSPALLKRGMPPSPPRGPDRRHPLRAGPRITLALSLAPCSASNLSRRGISNEGAIRVRSGAGSKQSRRLREALQRELNQTIGDYECKTEDGSLLPPSPPY